MESYDRGHWQNSQKDNSKITQSIKNKDLMLMLTESEEDGTSNKIFKPIVEHLQQIAKMTSETSPTKSQVVAHSIQTETERPYISKLPGKSLAEYQALTFLST